VRTTQDALRSLKRYVAELLGDEWEVKLGVQHEGMFKYPYARVYKVGPTLFSGPYYEAMATQPMVVHCYPAPQETPDAAVLQATLVEELLFQGFRVGAAQLQTPTGLARTASNTGGTLAAGTRAYRVSALDRQRGETLAATAVNATTTGSTGSVALTWNDMPGASWFYVYRDGDLIAQTTTPSFLDTGATTPNVAKVLPVANTTKLGWPNRIPLYDYDGVPLTEAPNDESGRPSASDYLKVNDFSIQNLPDPDDPRRIVVAADIRLSWRRTGRLLSGSVAVTEVKTDQPTVA
jgi:hypothetical protein